MTTRERMSIPTSFNKLQLIKLVQARPALWDKTKDSYRRKILKDAAWHEICRIMKKDYDNLSGPEQQIFYRRVGKIWRHIRDSWARSLNARKKAKKFGGSVRPYKYNREMAFLKKVKGPTKHLIADEGNTEDEKGEDDEEDGEEGEYEEDGEDGEDSALHEEKNAESGSDSVPAWDHDYECIDDNTNDEWNVDSKEGIITTINQDNATNEIDCTYKRKDNNTTENLIDSRITMLIDQMQKIKKTHIQEDRHYAFFKGVHPSLTSLDDDQVLEFQSGVINLIRNIKRARRSSNVTNNQPCSSSSKGFNLQPEARVSQQPVVAPRVTQNISPGSAEPSRILLKQALDPLLTD